jgi:hypothetical protein
MSQQRHHMLAEQQATAAGCCRREDKLHLSAGSVSPLAHGDEHLLRLLSP